MALNASRVSAVSSPGMAAAATARPLSGGRNVASVSSSPLEAMGFSSQIGVNDNRMWRYDEEHEFDFEGEHQAKQRGTPFIIRAAIGFHVDEIEESMDSSPSGRVFLNELVRGIAIYESNMRLATMGPVRPGSILNYRS